MNCKSCFTEKPATDFYVSNKTRCKECVKVSVKSYRQKNLERVRAYDKLRSSMTHRVTARAEYAKSEGYARSHAAAAIRWAAKHPERRRANIIMGNAIRDGRLVPWPVCAVPECICSPQGHHPDYSRPLDVVWLCQTHHKQAHAIVVNEPSMKKKA